ncbi:MAG: ribosomal protein [Planctomycetota bacterium]|jgi:large subunit ribosomal protein L29
MSKASSIRELSSEQLDHELRGAQESLFRLRLQAATERNDVPTNAKKLRRRIAQILTVRREREQS